MAESEARFHPNAKDLSAEPPFGKLKALRVVSRQNRKLIWECRCECGGVINVRSTHLTSGAVTSCGCDNPRNMKASRSPRWKGFGEISGTYWANVRHGAKLRGLVVEVGIDQAWHLFMAQQRLCALTGVELKFGVGFGEGTASLDRRDSQRGYTLDNLQWVHKDVNAMKMALDQNYFIDLCVKVAAHSQRGVP